MTVPWGQLRRSVHGYLEDTQVNSLKYKHLFSLVSCKRLIAAEQVLDVVLRGPRDPVTLTLWWLSSRGALAPQDSFRCHNYGGGEVATASQQLGPSLPLNIWNDRVVSAAENFSVSSAQVERRGARRNPLDAQNSLPVGPALVPFLQAGGLSIFQQS